MCCICTNKIHNKECDTVSLIRETVDDCKEYNVGTCPNWAVAHVYPTSDNVGIMILLYDNIIIICGLIFEKVSANTNPLLVS